ncbi:MAG TPA: hypothetical protein VGB08_01865 [Allosphingosinicella sp.]|jgi:hypothetical protein
MMARSFKSVGWVAGVGAAAIGCYMLSLQVAAERADLAGIEARIVRARQTIRDLQTELGTRGRLSQLEHWNAEVLALSAPVSGQYVENEVVLARLETRSSDLAGGAPVRLASAETETAAPAQPQVRTASAAAVPAPDAPARAAAPQAPLVRRASLTTVPAAVPAPAPKRAAAPAPAAPRPAATRTATAAPARASAPRAAAPSRAASLLDERTTRELGEAARTERGGAGGAEPRTPPRTARSARSQPKD